MKTKRWGEYLIVEEIRQQGNEDNLIMRWSVHCTVLETAMTKVNKQFSDKQISDEVDKHFNATAFFCLCDNFCFFLV
jgi:hypothetical protein